SASASRPGPRTRSRSCSFPRPTGCAAACSRCTCSSSQASLRSAACSRAPSPTSAARSSPSASPASPASSPPLWRSLACATCAPRGAARWSRSPRKSRRSDLEQRGGPLPRLYIRRTWALRRMGTHVPMKRLGLIPVLGSCLLAIAGASGATAAPAAQTRPNIVVIETDDQTQASLAYMPKTRALLGAQGATFDNSFVSYSLCCPSRSTFLTGQYAHNHGVLGNSPPVGGWAVFRAKHATNNLAVWLQKAGYYTALVGKFLNGYGGKQAGNDVSVPPGWSEWHAGVDLAYLGGTMSDDGKLDRLPSTEAGYQTDVWSRMAQDLIARRAPSTQPFFLWLTPHVPHTGGPRDPDDPQPVAGATGRRAKQNASGGTTRPPARYRNRFANVPLPTPPSFNEADVSDKPMGVRNLPLLTPAQIAGLREAYQQALEADLGVDDMVAAVVARLKAAGELDNTLIVFTSDNGFMYGEHRIPKGKVVLYEPSIRVPLVVRGPGVPKGVHLEQMAANVDLAPTIV